LSSVFFVHLIRVLFRPGAIPKIKCLSRPQIVGAYTEKITARPDPNFSAKDTRWLIQKRHEHEKNNIKKQLTMWDEKKRFTIRQLKQR